MVTLAQIYDWFMTGKKPTQAQFWASWGSFWNKLEQIPQSAITGLIAVLNSKADKAQFDSFKATSKIYNQAEMQVFKTREPDDPDFIPGQQEGDLCKGIVWDSEGNKKLIEGTYLGGEIKAAESYDYDTSINL